MSELPKKGRAAVLRAPRERVEIREIEILSPEPGAIVAQVEAATVCGTDVHIWQGDLQPEWPVGLGHEMVGRVAALGSGVVEDSSNQPLHVGDRIVWAYPWCGKCYFCTIARQPTLCTNARMNGWRSAEKYPFLCGGFADYCYILPECRPVKVPEEVESAVASSGTCALRTVVHAFERLDQYGGIGVQPSIAVLGTGPVGLYALAMSIASGASLTISIGAPQARIALAQQWGASHTINLDDLRDGRERIEMVKKWTGGRGADLVIEAAGPPSAFEEGIEMVRRGGRFLVIGTTGGRKVEISPRRINKDMVGIIGVVAAHVGHFYKAMQFLKTNQSRFDFSQMITNRYPLKDVNEALEEMAALREIKPAILPLLG
ncbi:MAG: zinc-binding dehydrogenase [Acidobacteria bacterium]|nr:zinc-binding dehydrogenase [Acidobacteriota bacterium]